MSTTGTALGIELGSTRIKATLVDAAGSPMGSGSFGWENSFENGVWTYSIEDAWSGIRDCVSDLRRDLESRGESVSGCSAIGISGMMHGYVALDENGELLVPFRTWRNNITGKAAAELTKLFRFPVPQRWSIAHLYQAILNGEDHLPKLRAITTLGAYIHHGLTGRRVVGIGEASGIFPVNTATQDYDQGMIDTFDELVADRGYPWKLRDLLPQIVAAGENAGSLTESGAQRMDPSGSVAPGLPFCAPEGDAGTGMIATNAIRPRGGNVSAGTSVFAMIVLEKPLSSVHEEIDLVTTPDGRLVAMVHSNNCTSDLDAWVGLLVEAARALGAEVTNADGFATLLPLALKSDPAAGGLLSFGYVSGEHVTGFTEGRPLFVRHPDAALTLPAFMRSHLMASLCAMRTGLDILTRDEGVVVEELRGHGGFFKTPVVGQRIMAAATGATVGVMETAGEGGAWGMALLAAYSISDRGETLADYLDRLFAGNSGSRLEPDPEDVRGFDDYFARYTAGLPIERAAVDSLKAN